jgi:hypothetical protein
MWLRGWITACVSSLRTGGMANLIRYLRLFVYRLFENQRRVQFMKGGWRQVNGAIFVRLSFAVGAVACLTRRWIADHFSFSTLISNPQTTSRCERHPGTGVGARSMCGKMNRLILVKQMWRCAGLS